MSGTGRSSLRLAALGTILLAGLSVAVTSCGGKDYGPLSGDATMAHVKVMVGHGPRPSGSAALDKTVDYIKAQITALGLTPEVQAFRNEEEAPGIEFENIWTEIPGADPENGSIILVCAHYDTKKTTGHPKPEQNFRFVGAMDGATPSALLLELARHLKGRPNPKATIRFVWFDGEESIPFVWDKDNKQTLFGSKHYANSLSESGEKSRVAAMVLLDMLGSKNFKIDRDVWSNGKLNELFLETANEMGESERMHRFVSQMVDDHLPFKNIGIRSIDLIDFRYRQPGDRRIQGDKDAPKEGEFVAWWHTPEDDLQNVDPEGLAFAGNLVLKAIPKIEAKFCK